MLSHVAVSCDLTSFFPFSLHHVPPSKGVCGQIETGFQLGRLYLVLKRNVQRIFAKFHVSVEGVSSESHINMKPHVLYKAKNKILLPL